MLTLCATPTIDPAFAWVSVWVTHWFWAPLAMSPATPAPLIGTSRLRTSSIPEPQPKAPRLFVAPGAVVLNCVTSLFCEPLPMTPATPAPSAGMIQLSAIDTTEPGLSPVSICV